MDFSLALARLWGFILLGLCGSLLIDRRGYANFIEKFQAEEIVFLYSLLAVIVGAMSVTIESSWTFDHQGLITLLGWSSLLKGFFGLLFPRPSIKFINHLSKYWPLVIVLSIIFFVLGIWLLLVSAGVRLI